MELIGTNSDMSQVSMSRDELLIISAALNEICNGIEVFEFETRIGATRDRVGALLKQLKSLLVMMERQSESGN